MKFQITSPRLRAVLAASLFMVCAAAGKPAFAQATGTTTSENIPFTATLTNFCNGDQVTFQGTMHITNSVTTDASGGFHLKTHVNYQDVTGTGLTGTNYRIGTTSNEVLNDSDSPQSEMTVVTTVKVIAPGPTLNYFLRIVLHITINANGETTSTVTEVSSECRGRN